MNILDRIVDHKRKEVAERKRVVTTSTLEGNDFFSRSTVSMKAALTGKGSKGIIAEFKRKSPSKGMINEHASPEETTRGYVQAGASALSVLTDAEFFAGASDDLSRARRANTCPILRKDFMIDEYQIVEAKSIGADAILLIAAVLEPAELRKFAAFAQGLGMEVLLEVHNEAELESNLDAGADLIGVNNRDLKSFVVSTEVSKRLAPLIPAQAVKVSESGISNADTIRDLRKYGYQGFLIGETFMKQASPSLAAAEFIRELQ
jgi:indole-3-glycerol phosphate synthase